MRSGQRSVTTKRRRSGLPASVEVGPNPAICKSIYYTNQAELARTPAHPIFLDHEIFSPSEMHMSNHNQQYPREQRSTGLQKAGALLMVLLIIISAFALDLPTQTAEAGTAAGISEYYIPGSADQLAGILYNLDPYLLASPFNLTNMVTISIGANDTIVQYDHWERGYGTAVETYTANRGSVLTFKSTTIPSTGVTPTTTCAGSTNPNGATTACYDGRDRISVTGGTVSVAQVFWPTSADTTYASAWEIYPVKPYQTNYILPVGEDLFGSGSFSDFQKVYVIVQALSDTTNVQINDPATAGVEVSTVLNRGGVTQLWHTHVGTTIVADKPIQVQFIIGNNSTHYNSRSFTAVPSGLWSSSYISPVPGAAVKNTDLFIFNPNGSPIGINYQDSIGSGTFQIAANSTASYQAKVGRYVPQNSAVSLAAADGVTRFWSIGSADAGSADYNWGFTLIPSNLLANEYFISWSPGSSNLATTTNGSPVFVSPLQDNTTIFVDYSPANGVVDATYTLNRLQEQKIFDPDKDNTGTHIWATAPIAAVWGEDPDSAPTGSPGIDAGYTILPYNQNWIDIVATLNKTANPSSIAPQAGQTSIFTLSLNVGAYGLNGLYITDSLPANWAYIAGSTTITWPGGSSTADPSGGVGPNLSWGSAGSPLANLAANQTLTIVYRAQTTDVPASFSLNTATSIGIYNGETYTASAFAIVVATQPELSIVKTNDLVSSALVGYPFTWNLQVLNGSSSGLAQFATGQVLLTDALPAGPTYGTPSVTMGAIQPGGLGMIGCSITSNVLTCTANEGAVTLPTGSIFTVSFSVTPSGAGTLVNPSGGVCQVDPNGLITESNEGNNNCANSVAVVAPSMTMAKTANPASGTPVGLGSVIAYSVTIHNTGGLTQNNVLVNDALPGGTTYIPGSSQLTYPSTYADYFNARAYNNNNGTLNFNGNWIESDSTQSATNGSVQVVTDGVQTYVLRPGNNGNSGPSNGNIYRVAGNLSSCTTVSLNYDYRRANTLEAGDFLYVDASSNGGGAWTNNVSIITAGSDAAYQASLPINLTAYRANLAVRFRSAYADNGNQNDNDTVTIDNVRLTCLQTILVHAPANMVTVADNIDLPAGMSMILTYSVTVNNPTEPGQTSVFNTASVFSNDQVEPLESTTAHPLPPATITGYVYNDLNSSGGFDAGEPGLDGVTVTLSNGATTTTNTAGFYSFANLPAGTYSMTETDPFGFTSSGDTQGANDNVISAIMVTAGATSAGNNFFDLALIPPAVFKTFGASFFPLGGSTNLTLTLGNPAANLIALAAVRVDDTFPGGLTLQDASFSYTPAGCGGVTNLEGGVSVAGDVTVSFTAANLAAGGSCQVVMNVTSSVHGALINTTGAVTSTQTGPGGTASASVTVLSIDAVDDDGRPVGSTNGGVSVDNVLVNDMLYGSTDTPATTGNVTLTAVGTWPASITLDTNSGAVTVAPGTALGIYHLQYQICRLDYITICDTATVRVSVPSPTSVNVASFWAARTGHTKVTLSWEMANELTTLGFYLYRRVGPQGVEAQLNASLIPTEHFGSMIGGSYAYEDDSAPVGAAYRYRIECIDINFQAFDVLFAVLQDNQHFLPMIGH